MQGQHQVLARPADSAPRRDLPALQSVQTSAPGSDPDGARAVLVNRHDVIAAQPLLSGVGGEPRRAHQIQTVLGADPDVPFAILVQSVNQIAVGLVMVGPGQEFPLHHDEAYGDLIYTLY